MLTRFLFFALVIYLAYRVIKVLVLGVPPARKEPHVQGKPKNRPLDLSNTQVEDAKFVEIKKNDEESK